MTTTTYEAPAARRRGRSLPTAGTLQWLTWVVVVGLILGPFVPLLYASIRDRPLYEAGGLFTLHAYPYLIEDARRIGINHVVSKDDASGLLGTLQSKLT